MDQGGLYHPWLRVQETFEGVLHRPPYRVDQDDLLVPLYIYGASHQEENSQRPCFEGAQHHRPWAGIVFSVFLNIILSGS